MIKKVAIIALVTIAFLSVAGCTSQQQTSQSVGNATQPTNADTAVTVKPVALSQQDQLAANKTGFKFVAYNCTVKNIGTTNMPAGYNTWELRDTQGGVYTPALAVHVTGQEWSKITEGNWWNPPSTSEPGATLHGIVVFEVPQNVQQFKSLTYNIGNTMVTTML